MIKLIDKNDTLVYFNFLKNLNYKKSISGNYRILLECLLYRQDIVFKKILLETLLNVLIIDFYIP